MCCAEGMLGHIILLTREHTGTPDSIPPILAFSGRVYYSWQLEVYWRRLKSSVGRRRVPECGTTPLERRS